MVIYEMPSQKLLILSHMSELQGANVMLIYYVKEQNIEIA